MIDYTYDPLYRLTSANYTGSYTSTLAYAYDAVGNRLTQAQYSTYGGPLSPLKSLIGAATATPTRTATAAPSMTATKSAGTPTRTVTPGSAATTAAKPTNTPKRTATPTSTGGVTPPLPTATPQKTSPVTRTPTRRPPLPPRGANSVLPFYWLSLSTTDDESSSMQLAAPAAQATATPTPSLSVARTITYTYDAVGNRLTQNDNGTLSNYTYDIANRLTNVNAQVYTWDNNGNLLNDGTSAYTYDQANRIKTLTQGTNNYAFAYNGVSDRISQTVGVTQTRYTLDPAAGLTQVLSDGTATYLYGLGRIAQQQTNMQYFGADGLGSVRQMYNSSGQIVYNKRYDPFGNTISQSGVGTSNYGFTGEWTDATGLEYLRARYYAPGQGRFVTKDPSGIEVNLFLYASANPTNRTDPTGLMSGLKGLTGPGAFALCFAIHSGSQIPGALEASGMAALVRNISAQQAIDVCKLAYSKDAWSSIPFGESPTSGHNLFGIYVNESSTYDRLFFHAKDPLTKELSESTLLMALRRTYMQDGETTAPRESRFNVPEQVGCLSQGFWHDGLSFPITCVLGSVYFQLKTVNTDKGTYVGFRIDNRTDLESGSHIAFRFPDDVSGNSIFRGSVEDLVSSKQITGREPILDVMNQNYGGKKVVSILNPLRRGETGWYTSSLGIHELGGANLTQTFVWMERYDPCDPLSRLSFYAWRWHVLEEWDNWYPPVTKPIPQWGEGI